MALAGYVFVYTPLKRVSSLATVIGAVPGAIPPMMGWSAVRNELDPAAWVLFGILFFWQLPHFLAIAWLCREDYARGGFPMLTGARSRRGSDGAARRFSTARPWSPVSPAALALGSDGHRLLPGRARLRPRLPGLRLRLCPRSARHPGARRLMLASLLYFPALLLIMLLDRVVS